MEIVYTDSLEGITPDHLAGFFAGWPNPPTPATHLRMLQGSSKVWLARVGENGPVVGYITGLTDGVLAAYIPQLEVLPGYQGRGIGTELVRRLLADFAHICSIDLVCDPELAPFYARLGGRLHSAVLWRTYPHQSGAER